MIAPRKTPGAKRDRLEASLKSPEHRHPRRSTGANRPDPRDPGNGAAPAPENHPARCRCLDRTGGCGMTILEAAAALRAKKVSSLELVTDSLARIARAQPKLNAFITVLEDAARARASTLDAELTHGRDRGPLHGIPIAHKDLMMTKGVRTTAGSKIFADFIPDRNAVVVEKLDAAGAVLIGKTGLHEMAYGITSNNPHYGAVHNPWNLECITGGSSGGSGAAVAAGVVPLAP